MKKSSLPGVVVWLGVVSLLTDVGTEMIYPLLPMFLSDVLHAPKSFIGAVEGAAEAAPAGAPADELQRDDVAEDAASAELEAIASEEEASEAVDEEE